MGALAEIEAGGTVTGRVTKLMPDFGAFVEIAPGVEGLIHVSEVAHERIRRRPRCCAWAKCWRARCWPWTWSASAFRSAARRSWSGPRRSTRRRAGRAAQGGRVGMAAGMSESGGHGGGHGGRGGQGGGPRRDRESTQVLPPREDDPAMRKLRAKFAGARDLKGGLG